MKRSKRSIFKIAGVPVVAATLALAAMHLSCSVDDEARFAQEHPELAPTTQAFERAQSTFDPIAAKAQQQAVLVRRTADDVAQLGVPGASAVALIAGAVGTVLGVYNERRRGTTPLNTALAQVVRSVEAAFPDRTDTQKLAMSAIQDQATRELVESIKSS
jgi:hypothetical protein